MKVVANNSGESGRGFEVVVELDNGQAVGWPFGATSTAERLLVPEARRFAKELQEAITEAERLNKQLLPGKKLGDY